MLKVFHQPSAELLSCVIRLRNQALRNHGTCSAARGSSPTAGTGCVGSGRMLFSKAQTFEVPFLRCLSSDFFHISARFSLSTERRSRDSRNSAVPLHWLAGPRCAVPRDRAAGICTAGQIQEPTQRWPSGCSLQVGRAEIPPSCRPLNSGPISASLFCTKRNSGGST